MNRKAKTAMEVFDDILNKDHLDSRDLNLIIDQIIIFEDHIDVKLKADIDTLLKTGELPNAQEEDAANFKTGTE
ncbi:MAG: stage V sporulation protein T, partial [Clostridia bacterium]|nr:stage V sporulation protein T [Clostridia bacterium]